MFLIITLFMNIQARPLCTKALESGILTGLLDIRLEDNYDKNEVIRMIACAAASVRHSAKRRPKMSQVKTNHYA